MSATKPMPIETPEPEEPIAELLARAKAGSGEMFARLMARFRPMIWGLAWRMTLDHDDACDVCQQIVMRVWRVLPKYRPEQNLAGWMRKIAVREALRWLDQNKPKCRTIALDELETPPPSLRTENEAPKLILAGERRERIEVAMSKISPCQRTAIVLRFYNDMSIGEIAEAMECSAGSVKQHLFRAFGKLRRALKKDAKP